MADGTKPRTALRAAAAGVVLVVAAFVVLAVVGTSPDSTDYDCETFRVTPAQWAAADFDQRRELMDGIDYCKLIDGKSRLAVQVLIGPPDRESPGEIGYDLPFGDGASADRKVWRIAFDGNGRVKSSVVASPATAVP
jgi:hypothetical protein